MRWILTETPEVAKRGSVERRSTSTFFGGIDTRQEIEE